MTVYVDTARNHFGRMFMSHMVADTEVELHRIAEACGLRRIWFQGDASFPHYDICQSKRRQAIELGAIVCDRRTFVGHLRRIHR